MAQKQLGGLGTMGLPADTQAQSIMEFVNTGTTNLNPGDVVILEGSGTAGIGTYGSSNYFSSVPLAAFSTSGVQIQGATAYAITTQNNGTSALSSFTGSTALTVASTAGFASSGSLLVGVSGGSTGKWGVITYTSTTATTFVNCTGVLATGSATLASTLAVGNVVMQAVPNGFTTQGIGVTTTTTPNDIRVIGVVAPYDRSAYRFWNSAVTTTLTLAASVSPTNTGSAEGYVPGATVPIVTQGIGRIRISSDLATANTNLVVTTSGATVVGAGTGGALATSGTAGVAIQPAVLAVGALQGAVGSWIASPLQPAATASAVANASHMDANGTIMAWIQKM
jgi:hypothetical protein